MTVKTLVFCLFLYVCLAWVGAAYLKTGSDIQHYGLLWTAIGLIVVLAFILAARVFGWWKLWRARRGSRPRQVEKAANSPVHPDSAALSELLQAANLRLAKSAAQAGKSGVPTVTELPLYLLIGPENSGKSSIFLNSDLDPLLLAGDTSGTGGANPTRLCNLWFAKGMLFVEIGGRAFSGELERWNALLTQLRGQSRTNWWRRILGEAPREMELRGVIAFCECGEFAAAGSDPQRLERASRNWRERLRSLAEIFGTDFPVYQVVSKCDAIRSFPEFFRRLAEREAGEILGCTLPLRNGKTDASEVFAEAESKRLTASFRPVYHGLAEKRLAQLAHEPDRSRRPAIYEFPRELKRLRSPLVQFLTDVFRPDPLGANPQLRGYYLSGRRETEIAAGPTPDTRLDQTSPSLSMGSTQLFNATRVFQPEDRPVARRVGSRWLFIAELFHSVILQDALVRRSRSVKPLHDRPRKFALAGICGVCLLLCTGFLVSWTRNRGLLSDIDSVLQGAHGRHSKPASTKDLQTLDDLRAQLLRLQGGMPLSYHWGLYTGSRLLEPATTAYFRGFSELLLAELNGRMVGELGGLPLTPDADAPFDPVYRVLKTHLAVTSGACKVDTAQVSQVLKEQLAQAVPAASADWRVVAERQIDFYAANLARGNPVRLREDAFARDRARQYLGKLKGVDRFYVGLLAEAEKKLPKTIRLSDLAPNYAQVLTGPQEVNTAFSRDGWAFMEKASQQMDLASLGDPCVLGDSGGAVGEWKQNQETTTAIRRLYWKDYMDRWRQFIEAFTVNRYAGPEDAARKLEILADHKSPLLAVLAMTANQTSFSSPTVPAAQSALNKGIDKFLKPFKKTETDVKAVAGVTAPPPDLPEQPEDLARFFQPVHLVEPPGSETWVVDKNAMYIDALGQLRHSMADIAQGSRNPDPAVHQAAAQNYDKALDTVRQIARGFKPVGVGGLDATVQRLLEQPIRNTNAFIIKNLDAAGADKVNREMRSYCASEKSTFRKYPFASSGEDSSISEVVGVIDPTKGTLWQFVQKSLADFVVRDGSQWKSKDPAKKPQVSLQVLAFLNRAQQTVDALYGMGGNMPNFQYTLRPKLDAGFKDTILELEVDGRSYQWTTPLQRAFMWPPPVGAAEGGSAIARLRTNGAAYPFASRGGPWAIFRIFGDAEPRELNAKLVTWKYLRGSSGRAEPIQPAPVQLEIVSFPGNVDIFNPRFWEGWQCPTTAVQ